MAGAAEVGDAGPEDAKVCVASVAPFARAAVAIVGEHLSAPPSPSVAMAGRRARARRARVGVVRVGVAVGPQVAASGIRDAAAA